MDMYNTQRNLNSYQNIHSMSELGLKDYVPASYETSKIDPNQAFSINKKKM